MTSVNLEEAATIAAEYIASKSNISLRIPPSVSHALHTSMSHLMMHIRMCARPQRLP